MDKSLLSSIASAAQLETALRNIDNVALKCYKLAKLANNRVPMITKIIASTEAQNNFGRVLDDVVQKGTRYIIQRRNNAQAILLSLEDLESILLSPEGHRESLEKILREISPSYSLGSKRPFGYSL